MDRIDQVELADVTLECKISGEGPVVLAVHGFPDTPDTYRHQVPALVDAGYQVVRPTLRGYAPSGLARDGSYKIEDVARDMLALAERYSPGQPVRYLGHDKGSVIGFVTMAMAPERFSHFATLSIGHPRSFLAAALQPRQLLSSWHTMLFQIPGLGESRLRANDFALVERLWRNWSPGYQEGAEYLAGAKNALRGRERAVLTYYRKLSSLMFGPARQYALAMTRVPTLHMHGARDTASLIATTQGEERFFEGPFEFRRFDNAGHFLHLEQPAEVNSALLTFFARRFAPPA
jgi:pimeloyl-ACP methyl ester carboxylesterase